MEKQSKSLGAGHFSDMVGDINIHYQCFLTKFHPPPANSDQIPPRLLKVTIHSLDFKAITNRSAFEIIHY